jgi:hypothetical protein
MPGGDENRCRGNGRRRWFGEPELSSARPLSVTSRFLSVVVVVGTWRVVSCCEFDSGPSLCISTVGVDVGSSTTPFILLPSPFSALWAFSAPSFCSTPCRPRFSTCPADPLPTESVVADFACECSNPFLKPPLGRPLGKECRPLFFTCFSGLFLCSDVAESADVPFVIAYTPKVLSLDFRGSASIEEVGLTVPVERELSTESDGMARRNGRARRLGPSCQEYQAGIEMTRERAVSAHHSKTILLMCA